MSNFNNGLFPRPVSTSQRPSEEINRRCRERLWDSKVLQQAPIRGQQILPSYSGDRNPNFLKEQGKVGRRHTPFGNSNVVLNYDGSISETVHTKMDKIPAYIESQKVDVSELNDDREVSFNFIENQAMDTGRVLVKTNSMGRECSYESFIISSDLETRTFLIKNPFGEFSFGDSNALVTIDRQGKTYRAGLVSALVDGRQGLLRCEREDSVICNENFSNDIPIFNYQLLNNERVKELIDKIGNRKIKIINGEKISKWKACGDHNYDLRECGLSIPEQLAFAGHLVFETFKDTESKYIDKEFYDAPCDLYSMKWTKTRMNIYCKTAVVDAISSVSYKFKNKEFKIFYEINADSPEDGIQGPNCAHVGMKITCSDKSLFSKIVGHILVDQVDAYRPNRNT